MSEAKPKRMVWQVNLSTAITVMFAAGGLSWINMMPRPQTIPERKHPSQRSCREGYLCAGTSDDLKADTEDLRITLYRPVDYGWPVDAIRTSKKVKQTEKKILTDDSSFVLNWNAKGLWLDVLVSLAILSALSVSSEIVIHRREAPRH